MDHGGILVSRIGSEGEYPVREELDFPRQHFRNVRADP